MNKSQDIERYIQSFPKEIQVLLRGVHDAIRSQLPSQVGEAIKYGIPTFVLQCKNVVHYGGYKTHIGFYPSPAAIISFEQDLLKYKTSKGAVQFSIDQPLPIELIKKISAYRLKEVLKKVKNIR